MLPGNDPPALPLALGYLPWGGGNDMLIGVSLTFHTDGRGILEEWGFDQQHIDPSYVTEPAFQ